jgi:hypothetical protein
MFPKTMHDCTTLINVLVSQGFSMDTNIKAITNQSSVSVPDNLVVCTVQYNHSVDL